MDKKIALVTGGAGGIGTAICRALSDMGAHVVASCSQQTQSAAVKSWEERQATAGYHFSTVYGDVTDFASCQQMVKTIEEQVGPLSIVVNNAGITRDSTLRKLTPVDWAVVLRTNLDSIFNVCRQVVEGMLTRQYGRIINISSINGQKGQFGQTNYSASKAGMHGFTKALAQEVASKGITVNTISPGYVATEMVKKIAPGVLEKIIAQIPVGRLAEPTEIARVVAFLASEDAGFITGANIAINGGQHMY